MKWRKGRFHESGRNELLYSNGWTWWSINLWILNFMCRLTRAISHTFNAFGDEKLKIFVHSIARSTAGTFWAYSFTDNCRSFHKYRISLRAKAQNSIFIYLSECAHCTRESDALIFVFLHFKSATEQLEKKYALACIISIYMPRSSKFFNYTLLLIFFLILMFFVLIAGNFKFSFSKSLKPRKNACSSFEIWDLSEIRMIMQFFVYSFTR